MGCKDGTCDKDEEEERKIMEGRKRVNGKRIEERGRKNGRKGTTE